MATVIRGALWKFIVTDLDSVTLTDLDRHGYDRTVLAPLNAPRQHTASVLSDDRQINLYHSDGYPFLSEGNRLIYGFRREGGATPWKCRFAGPTLNMSDGGEGEQARSAYTAYDPWQVLYGRPALNDDAGVPNEEYPTGMGVTFAATTPVSEMVAQILYNSITPEDVLSNGVSFIDAGVAYGGTGDWAGVIEVSEPIGNGVTDVYTIQQGKSVGEVWDDLVGTGLVDIVLTPVYDPVNRPGIACELSVYAAPHGIQRYASVLAWDRFGRSVTSINRLIDGTQRANAIHFHAGKGGPPCDTFEDAASIAVFREWVAQQFFPDKPRCAMVNALAARILQMRADGVTSYQVSPAPERSSSPLLEYAPGDVIPMYASQNLRQTLAEQLRVYAIPIEISDDGVEQVRNLVMSPDLAVNTS